VYRSEMYQFIVHDNYLNYVVLHIASAVSTVRPIQPSVNSYVDESVG
jgi:hypothetical protein